MTIKTQEPLAQPINQDNMATDPLAFPIYVLTPSLKLPETGSFYVISRNGLWFHKDTGIMRGMVKVDGISHLEDLSPTIGMRIPNIPEHITLRALIFFRKVYKKHYAESEVQLFFNKEHGKFQLFCPEQTVSHGGVKYKPDQWEDPNHNLNGYLLVGTIHSHCNFAASHSNTDLGDERHADGIHITIGHVDMKEFSCVCSMQLNNHRARIDPSIKLLGLESAQRSGYGWANHNDYYRLKLPIPKHELKAIIVRLNDEIEKEWMPKVRQEFFRPTYDDGYQGHFKGGHTGPSDHRPSVLGSGSRPDSHPMDGRAGNSLVYRDKEADQTVSSGNEEIAPPTRAIQPDRPMKPAVPSVDEDQQPAKQVVSFRQTEQPASKTLSQHEEPSAGDRVFTFDQDGRLQPKDQPLTNEEDLT